MGFTVSLGASSGLRVLAVFNGFRVLDFGFFQEYLRSSVYVEPPTTRYYTPNLEYRLLRTIGPLLKGPWESYQGLRFRVRLLGSWV